MPTTQTIPIDLNTRGANPVAFTHQGDTARAFAFEVYNNGEEFALTGYTAKIGAILPADRGYTVIAGDDMATGSISENTITATLPAAYTAKAGHGLLTIILTGSGGTLRPINIDLRIQKSADAEDVIAGASDFPEGLEEIAASVFQEYLSTYLPPVAPSSSAAANKAADAKLTGEALDDLKSDLNRLNDGGLILKDDVIAENVTDWLDDHPEATTTVQDGAITYSKLNNSLKAFVTPEMYGAIGDGSNDDTAAVQAALDSGLDIVCKGTYRITSAIQFGSGADPQAVKKKRIVFGKGRHLTKYNSGQTVETFKNDATFIFDGGYFQPLYVAETTFLGCVFMGATNTEKTQKAFYKTTSDSCSHLIIYNCAFSNFDKAINFENATVWSGENEFRYNHFVNCNYAFYNQIIVDSYVVGNVFHSSCVYSWWVIGGGTFYTQNHDYSQKGMCASSLAIIDNNYFDGLNKCRLGIDSTVGGLIITNNLFLYNAGVADSVQGGIITDNGVVNSTICNNVIGGTINISGFYPSLILLTGTGKYLNNNKITGNKFDKNGCAVIQSVDLSAMYYANECDEVMSIKLTKASNIGTLTYKIQDIGTMTRIVFQIETYRAGTLLNVFYSDDSVIQNMQKSANFTVHNKTTKEFILSKLTSDGDVSINPTTELSGVNYSTDGLIVKGEITLIKGNAPTNTRHYYTKRVTL